MKQELVRTKSKISSLKREMSSIQQLHLAQQQGHAQLSAPTIISSRQEHNHQLLHPTDQPSSFPYPKQQIPIDIKNLSISNNDESLSPPFTISNTSSSTQTSNEQQQPSSTHIDSSTSPSDEQLRLYLTETLQREKDSDV
jgi:hypothetical protein